MLKIQQKPYNLFLITGILIFISSFLCLNESTDFHLHDTYIVIPAIFPVWILSIVFILLWLLCLLTARFLYSKFLTWGHILLTLIGFIFAAIVPFFLSNSYQGLSGMPRRYYDYSGFDNYKPFGYLSEIIMFGTLIIIVGQLIYFINLIIGVYKRTK